MQAVVFNPTFTEALNLIGTFVFAVSGALLAIHKDYDIVGMIVLAEITAIGGGVVRDLILGAVPPAAFTDHISFLLPIVAVALLFVVYRYIIHSQDQQGQIQSQSRRGFAHRSVTKIREVFIHRYRNEIQHGMLIFDAAGLAVFCVVGATKALTFGMGPVEATALGALTAVGGGIMRDMLAGDKPTVLQAHSELYVIPAVLGAAIVVAVQYLHLALIGSLAAGIAVVVVFVLRIAALRYGWTAPQPKHHNETPDNTTDGS